IAKSPNPHHKTPRNPTAFPSSKTQPQTTYIDTSRHTRTLAYPREIRATLDKEGNAISTETKSLQVIQQVFPKQTSHSHPNCLAGFSLSPVRQTSEEAKDSTAA